MTVHCVALRCRTPLPRYFPRGPCNRISVFVKIYYFLECRTELSWSLITIVLIYQFEFLRGFFFKFSNLIFFFPLWTCHHQNIYITKMSLTREHRQINKKYKEYLNDNVTNDNKDKIYLFLLLHKHIGRVGWFVQGGVVPPRQP